MVTPTRPTFTGVNEYILVSPQYRGGRGIMVGDMVCIEWSEEQRRRRRKDKQDRLCKRIVGLPGKKQMIKGRQAWREVSVGEVPTVQGLVS